ncbi:hypothetical protein [Pseudooceanicola sp.]
MPSLYVPGRRNDEGGMTGSGLQKLAFFLLVALMLYATLTASGV